MPVVSASAKKPADSASDSRLEMVIVNRSLEAAKAISAGNSSSLIASMAIIGLASFSAGATSRPV